TPVPGSSHTRWRTPDPVTRFSDGPAASGSRTSALRRSRGAARRPASTETRSSASRGSPRTFEIVSESAGPTRASFFSASYAVTWPSCTVTTMSGGPNGERASKRTEHGERSTGVVADRFSRWCGGAGGEQRHLQEEEEATERPSGHP